MRTRISNALSTISVFALLIVVATSIVVIAFKLTADGRPNIIHAELRVEQIVVEPGDTLWSIAKAERPEIDPRDVINDIVQLNGLSSARIFPGQILRMPFEDKYTPLQFAESGPR